MRDLSLHILDLIENSIRAGATKIKVKIDGDFENDMLRISIEDNGPHIKGSFDKSMDPFYTTKEGNRTGSGLSLMKAAAEQASGRMVLSRSEMGGLKVESIMKNSHIDRALLGDVAATLSSLVCTNPGLNLICSIHSGGKRFIINAAEVAKELPRMRRFGLEVAREVQERIKTAMTILKAADEP